MSSSQVKITAPKKVVVGYENYIGKSILVNKTVTEYKGEIYYSYDADEDTTLKEITAQAKKEGLACRVWLPSTMGTCDYRLDRINVSICPDGDDFKISDIHIG